MALVNRRVARNRLIISAALVAVILLGLLSRIFPFLGSFPGDALWATAVYLGWAFVLPKKPFKVVAFLALLTAFSVEFLQLYQASWLMALRSYTLGRLVLGTTFYWPDLIAYTFGVLVGLLLDYWICSRK